MKKIVLVLALAVAGLTSCQKEDSPKPAQDVVTTPTTVAEELLAELSSDGVRYVYSETLLFDGEPQELNYHLVMRGDYLDVSSDGSGNHNPTRVLSYTLTDKEVVLTCRTEVDFDVEDYVLSIGRDTATVYIESLDMVTDILYN